MGESRAVKSNDEIEAMRWASKITCEGHVKVMQSVKAGMRESALATIFKSYCDINYFTGKVQPYTPIVCCGPAAATLHYIDNEKWLEDGQTMLID